MPDQSALAFWQSGCPRLQKSTSQPLCCLTGHEARRLVDESPRSNIWQLDQPDGTMWVLVFALNPISVVKQFSCVGKSHAHTFPSSRCSSSSSSSTTRSSLVLIDCTSSSA